MGNDRFNEEIRAFLDRHGIDYDKVSQAVECRIFSPREISTIFDEHAFLKKRETRNVSVGNIVGYDISWSGIPQDVFLSMEHFFDSNGDGYHTRSLGMLEYSSDEIVERLTRSFSDEPIVLDDTGTGNYIVSTNGLHRFTVLRALYLAEVARANGDEAEIERINQKYTIPALIGELDIPKTYSTFLLKNFVPNIRTVRAEYDLNYERTDRVEVITTSGETTKMNDEELIAYIKSAIKPFARTWRPYIREYSKRIKTFEEFISENFEDIFGNQDKDNGGQEYD